MIWKKFQTLTAKDKGNRFEDLCYDLLSEMNFVVDRQSFSGNGSADNGQDLIIQKPDPHTGELKPVCIVECKFRSNSTIGGADLWSPLLAVLELNVPSLLVITSSELTSTFKSRIRSISQNSRWGISFRKLERTHLEAIIQTYPNIIAKYFPELSEDQDGNGQHTLNIEPIIADIQAAMSIESDGQRKIEVTLHNTSPLERNVQIEMQGALQSIHLEGFQEKVVTLKAQAHPAGEDVLVKDETSECCVTHVHTKPPLVPISHIFVDPFGYVDKIIDALNTGATALISGRAGSGKSRVIAEVGARFKNTCIVDLSQISYEDGLVELLLEQIFSLPIAEIRELPDKFIQNFIGQNIELPQKALVALSEYIRQIKVEDTGFAEATARLCSEWFAGKLLAIDNIHRLTLFDLEFLKTLSRQKKEIHLLLATRIETKDMREMETLSFLEQHQSAKWKKFVIDASNTARLLQAYVNSAASDQTTRDFLKPWINVDSVQKFILALKKLKAAGVLTQTLDGKFRIYSLQGAHPDQQREILEELIALITKSVGGADVDSILAAAAIFGYHFSAEFIEHHFGLEGLNVLDRLEELEIISPLELLNGEQWMCFDHETTAELARENTRSLLRRRWHKNVLDYLLDHNRYVAGRDDGRIAEHYKAIGLFHNAAKAYHAHACFQAQRGRYNDCLNTLDRAKSSIDNVDSILIDEIRDLEIGIMHDFLKHAMMGSVTRDRRWRMLGAFKLALRLAGQEGTGRMAARYWFFKAQLERQEAPQNAELSMQKSLELCALDHMHDRAESHAWFSNFLKRQGVIRFADATYHVRQALYLTRHETGSSLRARCLLHAGALFLERRRPTKTPWWWSRAVDTLSGTKDIGTLAFALSDLAYIQALIHPNDPETRSTLLQCLTLAQQFDLHHIGARAAINIANWRYFFDFDEEACLALIKDAQSRIDITEDDYQQALLDFSCLNFKRLQNRLPINAQRERLVIFLEHWFADGSQALDGDQRLLNMLEYFWQTKDPAAKTLLERLNFEDVVISMGNQKNWYKINHGAAYATYY